MENRPGAGGNKLHAATLQVMQRAPIRDAFVNSFVPATLSKSPEDFQRYVEAEAVRWARIVREHNVRLE